MEILSLRDLQKKLSNGTTKNIQSISFLFLNG